MNVSLSLKDDTRDFNYLNTHYSFVLMYIVTDSMKLMNCFSHKENKHAAGAPGF